MDRIARESERCGSSLRSGRALILSFLLLYVSAIINCFLDASFACHNRGSSDVGDKERFLGFNLWLLLAEHGEDGRTRQRGTGKREPSFICACECAIPQVGQPQIWLKRTIC